MENMPVTIMKSELQGAGVAELVERFILSQDVAPSSRETYRRQLSAFLLWLHDRGNTSPDRDTILEYKAHLSAEGLSPFTVSGYMVSVRRFFAWTETYRLYPNIANGVKGAKKPRGFRKDPLTVEQVKRLLNSIPRDVIEGKRDYALLSLMINTGLRTIELERAIVGDIRQQSGQAVLWVQGKGRESKDDFVLLTESVLRPIREYLAARGQLSDNEPLFTTAGNRGRGMALCTRSIRRIVKQRLQGIDIVDGRLSAHSLRHTAVTLSLLSGATLQQAQAMARHANIATTTIYAHNIDRLRDAPEHGIERLLQAEAA